MVGWRGIRNGTQAVPYEFVVTFPVQQPNKQQFVFLDVCEGAGIVLVLKTDVFFASWHYAYNHFSVFIVEKAACVNKFIHPAWKIMYKFCLYFKFSLCSLYISPSIIASYLSTFQRQQLILPVKSRNLNFCKANPSRQKTDYEFLPLKLFILWSIMSAVIH